MIEKFWMIKDNKRKKENNNREVLNDKRKESERRGRK